MSERREVESDEFYVGYLPLPPGHRTFLWIVVPLLMVSAAAVALMLAAQQRSPGGGTWEVDAVHEIEGVIRMQPCAVLVTPGENMNVGAPTTYVLVSEGKFGAGERVRPFVNQPVRVRGVRLERSGRSMIELISGEDAVRPATALDTATTDRLRTSTRRVIGRVTLRGEIIDPKCYLGAMKPGGGKTHKACATLCIRGGIPPMFVTRDAELRETFYVLASTDGAAVLEEIVPFIGEPVLIEGELIRVDDMLVLQVDAGAIRRV